MVYTTQPLSAEQLVPAQMIFIGIFEDARVEGLAIREFPGLKKLWLAFFTTPPGDDEGERHPMMDLMLRLAQALIDENYRDAHPLINDSAEAFRRVFAERGEDNRISWDAGVTFYNQVDPGRRPAEPAYPGVLAPALPGR